MCKNDAAIGIVAPALKDGHPPIGAARVDVPNIGLGDGVRVLQHASPALTERCAVTQFCQCRHEAPGRAGEIGVPVARGVEQVECVPLLVGN